MCGIAGIFSNDSNLDPQLIIKMTDIIKYRGPDGHGYLGYNISDKKAKAFDSTYDLDCNSQFNLYFGHRRLSIIDLSEAGKQPMSYANDRYWITYNGEIYNYLEIKDELIDKGYRFKTKTDTEVILAAFNEYGTECLHKFNGMWSFAILDIEKNNLFCARDRMGVKPFYFYKDDKYFAFSSEIKQLLVLPFISRSPDIGVIFDFLALGAYNSIGSNTFFRNINELEGAHYMNFNLNNNKFEIIKWWDIDLNNKLDVNINNESIYDNYLTIFYDAVKIRLRSDVPVGSALSGGLDSSGIVCTVDKILKDSKQNAIQKTFTSISSFKDFDERNYADIVINHTNVLPFFTEPTAQKLIKDYQKLIWHHDEPFIGTSIFAGWCIAELTKQNNVTVTLDGQGPDEMMGGYYPFPAVLSENLTNFRIKEFISNAIFYKKHLNLHNLYIAKRILSTIFFEHIPQRCRTQLNEMKSIFNVEFYNEGLRKSIISKALKKKLTRNYFDDYSYKTTMFNVLPGILKQVDRSSMAFSVESRLPFLDYRIIEFVFSLPTNLKIHKGINKYVYRRAMKNILPDEIRNRTSKLGFVTPEPIWLKNEIKDLMLVSINSENTNIFFNKKEVIRKFNRFIEGKEKFQNIFWQIINLNNWYNQFIKNGEQ